MRFGYPIMILGIIILVLGIVFHFQGQGLVGPESSFMYSNPDWITYGQQIVVTGIVILAIGLSITVSKKG